MNKRWERNLRAQSRCLILMKVQRFVLKWSGCIKMEAWGSWQLARRKFSRVRWKWCQGYQGRAKWGEASWTKPGYTWWEEAPGRHGLCPQNTARQKPIRPHLLVWEGPPGKQCWDPRLFGADPDPHPLTNGSGSERPKNTRILRTRIPNTAWKLLMAGRSLEQTSSVRGWLKAGKEYQQLWTERQRTLYSALNTENWERPPDAICSRESGPVKDQRWEQGNPGLDVPWEALPGPWWTTHK